ncbi:MAG: hypothetical protein ABI679_06125 [Gemmatimonadota bacterium]
MIELGWQGGLVMSVIHDNDYRDLRPLIPAAFTDVRALRGTSAGFVFPRIQWFAAAGLTGARA